MHVRDNATELRERLAALDQRLPELRREAANARASGNPTYARNAAATLERAEWEREDLLASITRAERDAERAREAAERERTASERAAASANFTSAAVRTLERRVRNLEATVTALRDEVAQLNRAERRETSAAGKASDGSERQPLRSVRPA